MSPEVGLTRRPKDVEELGNIVIKAREGTPIRLKDVARIEMVSRWNTTATLDGKPCVMLLVSRNVDADAKETAKAVQAKLETLKKALPTGIELKVVEE
jgi:multidrug efflux pump subunit AcrB